MNVENDASTTKVAIYGEQWRATLVRVLKPIGIKQIDHVTIWSQNSYIEYQKLYSNWRYNDVTPYKSLSTLRMVLSLALKERKLAV